MKAQEQKQKFGSASGYESSANQSKKKLTELTGEVQTERISK